MSEAFWWFLVVAVCATIIIHRAVTQAWDWERRQQVFENDELSRQHEFKMANIEAKKGKPKA